MKSYRNVAAALLLALALTTSALAGEMQTGVASPQPTPAASSMTETAKTDGVIQTGEAASTPEAADTVTEIALNLLQSVFALI